VKEQRTRSFELRAALSLVKLFTATGRPAGTHAVLVPALERFPLTSKFPESRRHWKSSPPPSLVRDRRTNIALHIFRLTGPHCDVSRDPEYPLNVDSRSAGMRK
jgi:hypothetical protein